MKKEKLIPFPIGETVIGEGDELRRRVTVNGWPLGYWRGDMERAVWEWNNNMRALKAAVLREALDEENDTGVTVEEQLEELEK